MANANPVQPRKRSAGVLLHPTSLPGPYGIGDLGKEAYHWVDALARARQTWWQILPLGPTGYGDSPYQCFSAFAGNRYLISPELLVQDGLLRQEDLGRLLLPPEAVDYGAVIPAKTAVLGQAWENYQRGAAAGLRAAFDEFCAAEAEWLDDFALFMALKDAHGGASWELWPQELVLRKPDALAKARKDHADSYGMHRFGQFLFFRQWRSLKAYANAKGVRLIGDVPIFVSADSADVWANPELFRLDERRRPKVVAGVPPDYFSATGQLWGNPLYDWAALEKTGYRWWVARMKTTLGQVDVVRLDHFRGFESYWEVPAGRPDAIQGRWVKGPGTRLFAALRKELGGLPLIAEDLGLITPEVYALRDELGLPGMRVLQFAFGDTPANPFQPHNYQHVTVAYTGTHDNDTTRAWFAGLQDHERDYVRRYLGRDGSDIAWDFIRLAWSSVADLAVAPLQDVLNLGTAARMNFPGRPAGNWSWRYLPWMLNDEVLGRLGHLTELYGRS